MMVGKFFSNPKRIPLVAVVTVVAAFVCIALIAGLGIASFSISVTPIPTVEPIVIDYCGARLTRLCVISFGRDAFGDTIINLYVPQRTYPPFYLNIVRRSGENAYDCQANRNVPTSIYCIGAPINLGEGFEIQVRTEADNQMLARGTFTLTAFLVTTQIVDGAITEETPEAGSSFLAEGTSTPTATPEDETVTSSPVPTGTSSSSYPYP